MQILKIIGIAAAMSVCSFSSPANASEATAEETIQWISDAMNRSRTESVQSLTETYVYTNTYKTFLDGDLFYIVNNHMSRTPSAGYRNYFYKVFDWTTVNEVKYECSIDASSLPNPCHIKLMASSYKRLGHLTTYWSNNEGNTTWSKLRGFDSEEISFKRDFNKNELKEITDDPTIAFDFIVVSEINEMGGRLVKAIEHLIEVTGNKQPF